MMLIFMCEFEPVGWKPSLICKTTFLTSSTSVAICDKGQLSTLKSMRKAKTEKQSTFWFLTKMAVSKWAKGTE